MPRFLVEVAHDAEAVACARAARVFLESGSHFLTRADWGCKDGVHSAWMIVEADDKEGARLIVPPAFRARTRVVGLNTYSMKDIDEMLEHHRPR